MYQHKHINIAQNVIAIKNDHPIKVGDIYIIISFEYYKAIKEKRYLLVGPNQRIFSCRVSKFMDIFKIIDDSKSIIPWWAHIGSEVCLTKAGQEYMSETYTIPRRTLTDVLSQTVLQENVSNYDPPICWHVGDKFSIECYTSLKMNSCQCWLRPIPYFPQYFSLDNDKITKYLAPVEPWDIIGIQDPQDDYLPHTKVMFHTKPWSNSLALPGSKWNIILHKSHGTIDDQHHGSYLMEYINGPIDQSIQKANERTQEQNNCINTYLQSFTNIKTRGPVIIMNKEKMDKFVNIV